MHIIRSASLRRRLATAKSLAKRLAEILSETLGETFGGTLDETFRARQASPQSLGLDYMHGSPQDSLRDSFFYTEKIPEKITVLVPITKVRRTFR